MKKIGLLLGSFDPVTVAHVAMASNVINSGLCDKVIFVVAKHNPWKKKIEPAPFGLRCKMVEAAIEPLGDKAEVSWVEEEFEPPVYSYLPIGRILETYPDDEIYIIAGSDTIERIPRWKNFDTHINGKVKFIEITRGDRERNRLMDEIPYPFCMEITHSSKLHDYVNILSVQRMDVSSTMVRNVISKGMNPYPYVTKEVSEIINDNNLYRQ